MAEERFKFAEPRAAAAAAEWWPSLENHALFLVQWADLDPEVLKDPERLKRIVSDPDVWEALRSRSEFQNDDLIICSAVVPGATVAIDYMRRHVVDHTSALQHLATIDAMRRGGKVSRTAFLSFFKQYQAVKDPDAQADAMRSTSIRLGNQLIRKRKDSVLVFLTIQYLIRFMVTLSGVPVTPPGTPRGGGRRPRRPEATFPLRYRVRTMLSDPDWENEMSSTDREDKATLEGRTSIRFRSLAEDLDGAFKRRGGAGIFDLIPEAFVSSSSSLAIQSNGDEKRLFRAANDLCTTILDRAKNAAKKENPETRILAIKVSATSDATASVKELAEDPDSTIGIIEMARIMIKRMLLRFSGTRPARIARKKLDPKYALLTDDQLQRLREIVIHSAGMLDGLAGVPRTDLQDLVWHASRVDSRWAFDSYTMIVSGKDENPFETTWGYDAIKNSFVCLSDKTPFRKQDIDREIGAFRLVSDSRTAVAMGRAFARKIGDRTLFVYYGSSFCVAHA